MLSRRGRPTTTGQSHSKRLNTRASKRIVRELILLMDRPKLLMQIQLQTVLNLHVLILLALKTLYPNLSLELHNYPYQNLLFNPMELSSF